MREILFRGKRTDNGEWMYGSPIPEDYYALIRFWNTEEFEYEEHLVAPESISEFTGLTDKNGNKIFEGDIVRGLFLHSCPVNAVVAFDNGSFGLLWDRAGAETFWAFTSICNVEYEVIGNIHDNPELLKGDESNV